MNFGWFIATTIMCLITLSLVNIKLEHISHRLDSIDQKFDTTLILGIHHINAEEDDYDC